MPKQAGSLFRLQVTRDNGVTWENIPGEKVSGLTVGNEKVDTTDKDSQAANGMQQLTACGVRNHAITASGVVRDGLTKDLFTYLCNAAFSQTIGLFRVMSGLDILSKGLFLVQSFARSGEHNGAELWTLSLESAGEVVPGFDIPVPPVVQYASSYAISVRKIVDGYTGPCMRVRRSLDNAEQNIPFLNGWLDESALLAFVGSGSGFVTAWYNQTPQYGVTSFINSNALSQPKIVNAGVIYKSSVSLRPYVRFDRTRGDFLLAPQNRPYLYAAGLGMFMSEVSSMSYNTGGGRYAQFWQDANSGYRYPFLSRYFNPLDKDSRRFNLTLSVGLIVSNTGTLPSLPLSDFSVTANPAGYITTRLGGNQSAVALPLPFTQSIARTTALGEIYGGGAGFVNHFELVGQSFDWGADLQLLFAINQSTVFKTPGAL